MTQQNRPVMRSDDQDPIGTQASPAHVTRVACNLFSHKSVSRYRRPLKPGGNSAYERGGDASRKV